MKAAIYCPLSKQSFIRKSRVFLLPPSLLRSITCFRSLYFGLTLLTGLGSALRFASFPVGGTCLVKRGCERKCLISQTQPAHEDIFIPLPSYQKVSARKHWAKGGFKIPRLNRRLQVGGPAVFRGGLIRLCYSLGDEADTVVFFLLHCCWHPRSSSLAGDGSWTGITISWDQGSFQCGLAPVLVLPLSSSTQHKIDLSKHHFFHPKRHSLSSAGSTQTSSAHLLGKGAIRLLHLMVGMAWPPPETSGERESQQTSAMLYPRAEQNEVSCQPALMRCIAWAFHMESEQVTVCFPAPHQRDPLAQHSPTPFMGSVDGTAHPVLHTLCCSHGRSIPKQLLEWASARQRASQHKGRPLLGLAAEQGHLLKLCKWAKNP